MMIQPQPASRMSCALQKQIPWDQLNETVYQQVSLYLARTRTLTYRRRVFTAGD